LKTSVKDAERLFEQAYEKFNSCLTIKPDNYQTLVMWGDGLCSQVTHFLSNTPNPPTPSSHKSAPHVNSLFREAQERYQRAYQINPHYPATLFNWGNLNAQFASLKLEESCKTEAENMLRFSGELYQKCLCCYSVPSNPTSTQGSKETQDESQQNPEPDVLINWGRALVRLSELKKYHQRERKELLSQASELFLRAELKSKGSGCYGMACVSALVGQKLDCQDWLTRCTSSNQLPPIECVLADENFTSVSNDKWFQALLSPLSSVPCILPATPPTPSLSSLSLSSNTDNSGHLMLID